MIATGNDDNNVFYEFAGYMLSCLES